MKKLIPFCLLSAMLGVGATTSDSASFAYKYEIRASSMSYADQLMLYTYKKFVVSTYEKICLDSLESTHDELIRRNIDEFKIKDTMEVFLRHGTLVIVDGSGLGPAIRGDLRKNICDEDPIDSRFFFYDIFDN